MGTTIAGVMINGIGALIFNVGDSKVHCIDELSTEELTIEDRNPNQKTKASRVQSVVIKLGCGKRNSNKSQSVNNLVLHSELEFF